MAEETYTTLADTGEAETRVVGSTFIAAAAPADTEEAARAFLDERARRFHDATHNCSAWRISEGVWRASDAGEPSGSAGAPILAAIDGADLSECVVVVTRYFGGTKLGVGGLVRAYGDAAALAIAAAPKRLAIPALRLRIRYPYEHTAIVMRLVEQHGAERVEHGYATGGSAGEIELLLPAAAADSLARDLRNQSSGTLAAERLEPTTIYRPGSRGA